MASFVGGVGTSFALMPFERPLAQQLRNDISTIEQRITDFQISEFTSHIPTARRSSTVVIDLGKVDVAAAGISFLFAVAALTTAMQDLWHSTSDTWFDRTADSPINSAHASNRCMMPA